tara:strand:- start:77 stop:643 length:567 start_codon:yes stop_codon:yes gene_type:complete
MSELQGMRTFLTSIFLVACTGLSPASTSAQAAGPDARGFIVAVGDDVPDFELTDLTGVVHSRASLLGSVYVLQFTASWCSVCRAEMPHLESEVWQAFKDRQAGFTLLGVDLDEPAEKVADFAAKMKVTYPMCPDAGGEVFYSIAGKKTGVTRNVVVDQEGRIAMLTRLFDEEEFALMIEVVDGLTTSE